MVSEGKRPLDEGTEGGGKQQQQVCRREGDAPEGQAPGAPGGEAQQDAEQAEQCGIDEAGKLASEGAAGAESRWTAMGDDALVEQVRLYRSALRSVEAQLVKRGVDISGEPAEEKKKGAGRLRMPNPRGSRA